jgi:hypothetical protein
MKKRNLVVIIFCFSILSFSVQAKTYSNTITTPKGFKKIGEATGNLDRNRIKEKVIVYNTKREGEMGTEREIHIYKKRRGKWKLWHKSIGAVLSSDHGGMWREPFESVKIQRRTIVLKHFGGSRGTWSYTHRFRYQKGNWKLIGATIELNDRLCTDGSEKFDYNLSTGKIIYKKVPAYVKNDVCVNKKAKIVKFRRKLKRLPNMDGFYPGENTVKLPNGEEFSY